MTNNWASDVPISMPIPPVDTVVRKYNGFGVGWYGGVVHDLSRAEIEELRTPDFAPPPQGIAPEQNDG